VSLVAARLRAWFDASLGTRRAFILTIVAWSVAVALILTLSRGQDFNWDQRNYHLATPRLLLLGDFWASVAPSGIQSFYNPAVLLVQFLLLQHLPPMLAASVIALCQASVFVLAGLICARIAPPDPGNRQHRAAFLGFLLCLASPMALSEVGTTFIDLLTAVPVLLAYLLLMGRATQPGMMLAAGLLLGVATGLKLTNAMYVIGAAGFLLSGRPRLTAVLAISAGVLAGFLAAAGYWHLKVWQRFGNPFFPYYNNLFGSPDAPAVNLVDARFPASSPLDIVRYPMFWLFGGSPKPGLLSPTSETTLHDARFALAGVGAAAAALVWRRVRRREDAGLLAACLIVYLVWLFQFGIHRYVVGLEVLLGAVLLALCCRIPGTKWHFAALGLACAITLARFHVPNWGHLPWQRHWQGIAETKLRLDGPALVFITGKPTGYLAASLCCDLRVVGLSGEFDLHAGHDTSLTRQLRMAVAQASSIRIAMQDELPPWAAETLASYGLRATAHCQPLRPANVTFELCDVGR
jgi:hypothetical protein